jgi:V8-like Glu-specific endopeptidase
MQQGVAFSFDLGGPTMGELSGQDIKELSRKLADTLSFDDLESFVYASTGDRLYDAYVARGKPLIPTIFDLLNALENEGTTPLFLSYVYARRPGRGDVRQAVARVALSAQTAGVAQPDAPTNAFAPGLQRNVRPHLAKLDVRVWLERLVQIEHRVCRVELDGSGLGTGFLVGPDTVLTNWHVVEAAKAAGRMKELRCRFDYVRLPDGTMQAGQAVALHADGCLNSSPYSGTEKTDHPDDPPPSVDELDYALIRLATPLGQQAVDGKTRGWITLPAAQLPLAKDAPLLIVQHPEGGPMKLALDTQAVIGVNANGTRVRYRTNTDPGSSGSPCFTMDWDLVALHHYGDPKWLNPLFNQGVPIALIRRQIEAQGFGNTLAA